MYYFIRVNGPSAHVNPVNKDCFVEIEPEEFQRAGYSNYLSYCLANGFIRIGWPDVGDLRTRDKRGAKSQCYDWETIKDHERGYLTSFYEIELGSIILVPDRDNPGMIYIGVVNKPYWYETDGPYECSHRIGVVWDGDMQGKPQVYSKDELGIHHYGGMWLRAFSVITDQNVVKAINKARKKRK